MSIPKSIGACADKLYKLREARHELSRKIKEIEEEEKEIKDFLINNLSKSDSRGVSGKVANVTITTKDTPIVEDWEVFYKYVGRTKSYDLLQRRLNTKAVEDRVEHDKNFHAKAGLGVFKSINVSITKLNK